MSDTGSPADHESGATTLPPVNPPHTDPVPCQDVPAASSPHPASPEIQLAAESAGSPQCTGETLTEGGAAEQTAQGPADQPEPPSESQVVECDQPVSLEPDAAEDNVEVCTNSLSGQLCLGSCGCSSILVTYTMALRLFVEDFITTTPHMHLFSNEI